jgi:hypothetical protein
LLASNGPPGLRETLADCHNRKRPTLGDKVDLLQEKGDKSKTLTVRNAIDVPTYQINVFFKKTQH